MIWLARAAIRTAPPHAVVPESAVEDVETEFSETEDLEGRVDRAFSVLDAQQPAIARFLAREVDPLSDETAQALGHFLGVAVHEAFLRAFGQRVRAVDDDTLERCLVSYECDEEMRRESPNEVLESDDVVAFSQPALVSFVRQQLDAALEEECECGQSEHAREHGNDELSDGEVFEAAAEEEAEAGADEDEGDEDAATVEASAQDEPSGDPELSAGAETPEPTEAASTETDLDAVARVYRAVLVVIMALSESVTPPRGMATVGLFA